MKISHALLSTFLFIGLPSGCAYQDAFYSPASQESLRPPSKPRSFLPFVSETEILPIQRSTTSLDWNVSQNATGSTDFSMRTLYQMAQRHFTVRTSINTGSTTAFNFFEGAKFRQTYPIFDISKLDILVVVDNSQSIDTEQEKLSKTFHDLVSQVQDRDWRIIVTSHEALNCDATIVSKDMADAEAKFTSAIKMGQTTSNSETPFYKTLRMLRAFGLERKERNGGRATFTPAATACTYTDNNGNVKSVLRENVPVGVLIMTNEDECSNGYNCPMLPGNTRIVNGFYSDRIIGLAQTPYGGHFRVAGIYWPPGTTTSCAGALRRGDSLNNSFTKSTVLTVAPWTQSIHAKALTKCPKCKGKI